MFTGIVEGMAKVEAVVPRGQAYRLTLQMGSLTDDVKIGDSVAIEGTCLTVVTLKGELAEFDVIRETVERTTLAAIRVGDSVNVERSMRADGRFHGHFVSGHVDGTGQIKVKRQEPGQVLVSVEVPPRLTALMIEKGSVAIDGVSLALTDVSSDSFSVCLIPHTLEITTLGNKNVGSLVNIEVDPMAKWIRRLLTAYMPGGDGGKSPDGPKIIKPSAALGVTLEELRKAGFVPEGE